MRPVLLEHMNSTIPVIDLFAGPGGLGEGFSAFQSSAGDQNPFNIGLSVEKEASAVRTLKLRAFFRQFPPGEAPEKYYEFLAGNLGAQPEDQLYRSTDFQSEISNAEIEARQLTLGEDDSEIDAAINKALGKKKRNWVLIGGPPCQAYSLVGRSRNKGIKNYSAKKDHRNFLYREYLRVIAKFQPAVFVMENVKGLLSAKIDGNPIIDDMLTDLECPSKALGTGDKKTGYNIFSLVLDQSHVGTQGELFEEHPGKLAPRDYLIRSEDHGVPQGRHRIILLGVRTDKLSRKSPGILKVTTPSPTIHHAIGDLPKLRSGLSKGKDSLENWVKAITSNEKKLVKSVSSQGLAAVSSQLEKAFNKIRKSKLSREPRIKSPVKEKVLRSRAPELADWILDPRLHAICNHETRGHIASDLQRYLFCACYGEAAKAGERSTPKAEEFPNILKPNHANWTSGHFSDRFRVQARGKYGTTVTSHISKDGHYFIHYDPDQCRSLTVREAARIQTFPDNYYFVGNRTQQYVQVGNAVPPYLANQIAEVVYGLFR